MVANFFRDSAHRYISIPSASAVPRAVFEAVGGFPEGMKIGGDKRLVQHAQAAGVVFGYAPAAQAGKLKIRRLGAVQLVQGVLLKKQCIAHAGGCPGKGITAKRSANVDRAIMGK